MNKTPRRVTHEEAKPFYHESKELVQSDIVHLVEELDRICKQHSLPYQFVVETKFSHDGVGIYSASHYPEARYQAIGLTSRAIMCAFSSREESHKVEEALALLVKHGIIE